MSRKKNVKLLLWMLPVVLALAAAADVPPVAAGQGRNNAKNIYDVRFETLPGDCERLVETDIGSWDFNFRPYGRTSDLWTDPSTVRDVGDGRNAEGSPSALRVSCDAEGWSFLVFCGEPPFAEALAKTNALPYPTLEIYFASGDTDNYEPCPYWQLLYERGPLREIRWATEGRAWRNVEVDLRCETRLRGNGFVVRFDFPWELFWDRLPIFCDRADNFWRLSVIRWASGGVTWGGEVHEPNRFGYIRWPAFSDAQKTEIMERLLYKAWHAYKALAEQTDYNTSSKGPVGWNRTSYVRTEPYAVDAIKADGPRSYAVLAEDPGFYPVLTALVAECDKLAPGIAAFRSLPLEKQEAFYKEASARLFNFRYDVEEAYGKYEKAKIMAR